MTRWNKIQTAVLAGAVVLALWQFLQHVRQTQQLALLEEQVRSKAQELETRKTVLDQLDQRQKALVEDKKARENSIVEPLVRERAAAATAMSAAEAAAQAEKSRAYRKAMANALDNSEQREINRQLLRNEIKARVAPLVKKLYLTSEQADQFRDLLVENELQKNDRLAALLRETVKVTDALQQRDAANLELQSQLRSLLGDAGYALYDEGNQNSQKANAGRVIKWMQHELGSNLLDDQQNARLGALVQSEMSGVTADDTDAFRPTQDLEQFVFDHQQNVMRQAASFITVEQMTALRKLADEDRARIQEEFAAKRKGFGLTE